MTKKEIVFQEFIRASAAYLESPNFVAGEISSFAKDCKICTSFGQNCNYSDANDANQIRYNKNQSR